MIPIVGQAEGRHHALMENAAHPSLRGSRLSERLAAAEPAISRMMRQALAQPEMLSLAAGFTDNALLPVEQVERVLRQLRESGPSGEFLQYGRTHGRPGLRTEVVRWLARYPGEGALRLSPDQVLITNGSQQALYMTAQLLCDPGDSVLVEAPSYFVFLDVLKGLGLRARSLPVTGEGRVDMNRLAQRLEVWERTGELKRIKLLYFMGTYANPSSRSWLEADKCALGALLGKLSLPVPVLEDMAYRDLWFDEPWPARSVLSLPEWRNLPALYAGTFTKPFATGLKVGYVASHCREWVDQLARIKGHHDFGTPNLNQAILEAALQNGDLDRHLEVIRPVYRRKMEVLDEALRAAGLEDLGWRWERPKGGLLLWITAPEGYETCDGSPFFRACWEAGVFYVPGNLCFAEDAPGNTVRLSFGVLDEAGLREAARRFAAAAWRTPVSKVVKTGVRAED